MKYNPKIVLAYYRECGLPESVLEFRFHPVRQWRFDFAWPVYKVALEVEGGIFKGGRHSRGAGMKADMQKYNSAASKGWLVLRVVPDDVAMLDTVNLIKTTMEARP